MAESSQSVNMDSMIQRFDQMANAVEKALCAIPDAIQSAILNITRDLTKKNPKEDTKS